MPWHASKATLRSGAKSLRGHVLGADDRKNSERVECKVTERMLLDISRAAAIEDRSVSDFMRIILRDYLYGHCRAMAVSSNDDISRDGRDSAA